MSDGGIGNPRIAVDTGVSRWVLVGASFLLAFGVICVVLQGVGDFVLAVTHTDTTREANIYWASLLLVMIGAVLMVIALVASRPLRPKTEPRCRLCSEGNGFYLIPTNPQTEMSFKDRKSTRLNSS